MTALLIVALLAAPDVQVSITPDQPLPFAYVDEPLIVEVSSPTEKEAVVQVEIDGQDGPATVLDLGPVDLAESGAHWSVLEGVAPRRDRYRARFTMVVGGVTLREEQGFCRIDRPIPGYAFPLSAAVDDRARENLPLALAAVPGRAIRLEAGTANLEARVEQARDAGLQAVIGLPLARMAEPVAEAERLAGLLGDRVARWEIEGAETPAVAAAVADAVRRSQPRAALGLVVRDPGALARLLQAGTDKCATAIILDDDAPETGSLLALRAEAERAGCEGLMLVALSRGVERGTLDPGPWLVKQVLQNLSAGAESTVHSGHVLNGEGFGAGYVSLCGLAHRLKDAAYAGEIEPDDGVRAQVFRTADRWILALWAKGAPQRVALKLPQARELVLTDARNNPLDVPAPNGDLVTLEVAAEPIYLSGKGGTVLADAARRMALEEAQTLLTGRDAKLLPAELAELLRRVVEQDNGSIDRRGFLTLVGLFQPLEAARRSGKLPAETVVPVTAGLARLLRHLSVVEHERGEPFLEPLQEMLAKCSDYTSKYLSGAPNGNEHRREEWILTEVGRLMAEARQLEEAGRLTEADAVAALAEGRARALHAPAEPVP